MEYGGCRVAGIIWFGCVKKNSIGFVGCQKKFFSKRMLGKICSFCTRKNHSNENSVNKVVPVVYDKINVK